MKGFWKALAEQYPDLNRDALERLMTGKSLFISRHKLRPGFSPEYARLVLMRALGIFYRSTHLPAERLRLHAGEQELLSSVIDQPSASDRSWPS